MRLRNSDPIEFTADFYEIEDLRAFSHIRYTISSLAAILTRWYGQRDSLTVVQICSIKIGTTCDITYTLLICKVMARQQIGRIKSFLACFRITDRKLATLTAAGWQSSREVA